MTATTSKLGADMTDDEIREHFESHAIYALEGYKMYWPEAFSFARALLTRQPAAIDNEADDDIKEAREILENMVRSIELDGNYSTEATCTFLRQALNCLPVAAPLANEASKPAPSVEQDERGAKACPFCGGSAEVHERNTDDGKPFYVQCDGCYIEVAYAGTREASLAIWNARTASTSANGDRFDPYRLKVAEECCERLMSACTDAGCPDGVRMDDWIRENIRSTSANVAQGWKLVPVEPTDEMKKAGTQYAECAVPANAVFAYRAMLAAAPIAPSANVAQGAHIAMLEAQLIDARARLDRATAILTRIHSFMMPEDVRLPDGRVMQFSNSEVERKMLRGLCKAIRAVPDEIANVAKGAEALADDSDWRDIDSIIRMLAYSDAANRQRAARLLAKMRGALTAPPAQTANVTPMPQAVVTHEKLGPLFDRLSMHFYADKCMRIAAPPAQTALTDDARNLVTLDRRDLWDHVRGAIHAALNDKIPKDCVVSWAWEEATNRTMDIFQKIVDTDPAAQSASGDTK